MAITPATASRIIEKTQEYAPVIIRTDWPTVAAIVTVVLGIYALVIKIISRKKEDKSDNTSINRIESDRIRDAIKVEIKELYNTLENVKKEVHDFEKDNIRSGGNIKRLEENITEIRIGFERLEVAMDNCPVWEMEKDVRELKVRVENLELGSKSSSNILNQLSGKVDKVNDLLIDWLKNQ